MMCAERDQRKQTELKDLSKNPFAIIRNQSGVLTFDFLFGIVITFSMITLFLTFSFTMSAIEVAQYISYSTARVYMAANIDKNTQDQNARRKFASLMKNDAYRMLFRRDSGMFELTLPAQGVGTFGIPNLQSDPNASAPDIFTGVRLRFYAKQLERAIPFLGNTVDDAGVLTANISSYLMREPTDKECFDFAKGRYLWLTAVDPSYQRAVQIGGASQPGVYKPITDNGCGATP